MTNQVFLTTDEISLLTDIPEITILQFIYLKDIRFMDISLDNYPIFSIPTTEIDFIVRNHKKIDYNYFLRRLDQGDKWLIEKIISEIENKYSVSNEIAIKWLCETNFLRSLINSPIYTHHESIQKWVEWIWEHKK